MENINKASYIIKYSYNIRSNVLPTVKVEREEQLANVILGVSEGWWASTRGFTEEVPLKWRRGSCREFGGKRG